MLLKLEASTLFPVGALFVFSFVSLIKGEITHRHTLSCTKNVSFKIRAQGAFSMFFTEAPLFLLLCFLATTVSLWNLSLAKFVIFIAVASYISFSFSLVSFGRFPSPSELYTLFRTPKVLIRYLPVKRIVGIFLLWSISLIWLSIQYSYLLLALLFILIGFAWLRSELSHLQSYGVTLSSRKISEISKETFVPPKQALSGYFIGNKPNIVVVIVESLSAVDSLAISGIDDNLPRLDEFIRKNGKIYSNFFSPTRGSWHGIAFLFGGYRAMHSSPFPGGDIIKSSIVSELSKKLGYSTFFLSSSNLSYGNELELYTSLGFENILGSYQIDSSHLSLRGVFDSVPDKNLYSYAINQIPSLKEPFLYSIYTTDGHYESSWRKIDAELVEFLSELELTLPENTLVLVVGDHRKHGAPKLKEEEAYGWYGSRHRAFLGAFGYGILKGSIDKRIFSSFDLMWSLEEVLFGENSIAKMVPLQPSRRALIDPERKRWVITTDGVHFEPTSFRPTA